MPDRLFHSIDSSYKSVLTNPTDLKELIPEFYDPDCFDFLINSTRLQLGNLQTGQRVNDVLLPSWAKSAKSFLQQNRAALECDYCTQHLPDWIDGMRIKLKSENKNQIFVLLINKYINMMLIK